MCSLAGLAPLMSVRVQLLLLCTSKRPIGYFFGDYRMYRNSEIIRRFLRNLT